MWHDVCNTHADLCFKCIFFVQRGGVVLIRNVIYLYWALSNLQKHVVYHPSRCLTTTAVTLHTHILLSLGCLCVIRSQCLALVPVLCFPVFGIACFEF